MNITLTIHGQIAIPVRALPYAASWAWEAATDAIVRACARPPETNIGTLSIPNRYALATYLITGDSYRPMRTEEWNPIAIELESLTLRMKSDERQEDEYWALWRKQSILLLPDGAFVWLDEFHRWFSNTRPLKDEPSLTNDIDEEPHYEQESDVLQLDPVIPNELKGEIFRGFKKYFDAEEVPQKALTASELADIDRPTPLLSGLPGRKSTQERRKPGRKPGTHREDLTKIVDALEEWAKREGRSFDRKNMPGPLGNAEKEGSFHWLCAKIYPTQFLKTKRAFEEHRAGICAIQPRAKPSDFYRLALPYITQKLHPKKQPKKGRKPA